VSVPRFQLEVAGRVQATCDSCLHSTGRCGSTVGRLVVSSVLLSAGHFGVDTSMVGRHRVNADGRTLSRTGAQQRWIPGEVPSGLFGFLVWHDLKRCFQYGVIKS
jgi:hypothetical protein